MALSSANVKREQEVKPGDDKIMSPGGLFLYRFEGDWFTRYRGAGERAETKIHFPVPERSSRVNSEGSRLLNATINEYTALWDLLRNPPPLETSNLDEVRYKQLIAETYQLVSFCLNNPRFVHTNLINRVLQRAIDEHPDLGNGEQGIWTLHEIRDEDRAGNKRDKSFGQVPRDFSFGSAHSRTQFLGVWLVQNNDLKIKKIGFHITAEGKIESITPFQAEERETTEIFQQMVARGPYPYKIQVPETSAMAPWFARLSGHWRAGQIKSEASLGILAEAVAATLLGMDGASDEFEGKVLSHFLVPRSRRDAGFKPWQIGSFLKPDVTIHDREEFIGEHPALLSAKGDWVDLPYGRVPTSAAMVNVRVRVKLKSEILNVKQWP